MCWSTNWSLVSCRIRISALAQRGSDLPLSRAMSGSPKLPGRTNGANSYLRILRKCWESSEILIDTRVSFLLGCLLPETKQRNQPRDASLIAQCIILFDCVFGKHSAEGRIESTSTGNDEIRCGLIIRRAFDHGMLCSSTQDLSVIMIRFSIDAAVIRIQCWSSSVKNFVNGCGRDVFDEYHRISGLAPE